MKIITPDYYKDFKCIGGECIDTCCAGWEVDVDKKSSAYYQSVEGEFGDRLRRELVELPVEDQFKLKPNGRCPFLNDKDLCDIYTALGEKALCDTCTNFPRHITEFGNTREIGISLSCPVSVKLIMEHTEPITFVGDDTDEQISEYNNIDAGLYFALLTARRTAYAICQDRTKMVNDRAILCLDFARKLNKKVKKYNHKKDYDLNFEVSELNKKYSDDEYAKNRLRKLNKKISEKGLSDKDTVKGMLDVFKSLEHIKEEWPQVLDELTKYADEGMFCTEEFSKYIVEKSYEYENLLVYYVYRYFLRAVFEKNVYLKTALGSMALVMQELIGLMKMADDEQFGFEEQITCMRIYSKETEHSEENLQVLFDSLDDNEMFSFERLVSLLFYLSSFL